MKTEIGLNKYPDVKLITVLVEAGLVPSNSEARRALAQDTVLVDGVKHHDARASLSAGVYNLQVGEKKAQVTIR